jgi:hypothetical protein
MPVCLQLFQSADRQDNRTLPLGNSISTSGDVPWITVEENRCRGSGLVLRSPLDMIPGPRKALMPPHDGRVIFQVAQSVLINGHNSTITEGPSPIFPVRMLRFAVPRPGMDGGSPTPIDQFQPGEY